MEKTLQDKDNYHEDEDTDGGERTNQYYNDYDSDTGHESDYEIVPWMETEYVTNDDEDGAVDYIDYMHSEYGNDLRPKNTHRDYEDAEDGIFKSLPHV